MNYAQHSNREILTKQHFLFSFRHIVGGGGVTSEGG